MNGRISWASGLVVILVLGAVMISGCLDEGGTQGNNPPSLSSFSPESENPVYDFDERIEFSIIASDADGDDLTIVWYDDGVEIEAYTERAGMYDYQSSVTLSDSYDILENLDLGTHVIEVTISDGVDSSEHRWTVTIVEGNNTAPTFLGTNPSGTEVNITEGEEVSFNAVVQDTDGDHIEFTWYCDDAVVLQYTSEERFSHSSEMTLTDLATGSHEVEVVATDGCHEIRYGWDVEVS